MFASDRFEAVTRGCHPAAFVTALRTSISAASALPLGGIQHFRDGAVSPWVTFCIRNATGSIFAACASSSITCSPANVACGALPARIQYTLIQLFRSGIDLSRYRMFGTWYIGTGHMLPLTPEAVRRDRCSGELGVRLDRIRPVLRVEVGAVEGDEVAVAIDPGADVHQRGRRGLAPPDLVPAHQLLHGRVHPRLVT